MASVTSVLTLTVLTVLSLILVGPSTSALECKVWTLDVCEPFGIPAGTVYLDPPSPPQWTTAEVFKKSVNEVNLLITTEPCRSLMLHCLCASAIRPCLRHQNETLRIPVPMCYPLCQATIDTCKEEYVKNGVFSGWGIFQSNLSAYPIDCVNAVDAETFGNRQFPNGTITIPLNGSNVDIPCSQQDLSIRVPRICKDPTKLSPDGNQCGFPCPLPSLTDDQYTNAKIMQGIVGWFSWVTSSLLIFCFIMNPAMRQFPKNLITMTAIGANIAAGAIILPTYAGHDEIWCGGEDEVVVPDAYIIWQLPVTDIGVTFKDTDLLFGSSACTFQGAMLQFGFLASLFWWVVIAFNMVLELYLGKWVSALDEKVWKWTRFGIYCVLCWGLSFICVVIPAAADRIKFASAATYCFVSSEEDNRYQLAFWFLPVGLALLFGCTFFLMAVIKIVWVMLRIRKLTKFFFLYFRLLLFLFLYLFLFVFIFAYNIQIEVNSGTITLGLQQYFKCLIQGLQAECDLSEDASNYNLVMLKGFAISSLGFFLFMMFMSLEVLRFWYHWGKKLINFFRKRDANAAKSLLWMILSSEGSSSVLGTPSLELTATQQVTAELEGEEEDEEESDDKAGSSSINEAGSSSSSED